MSSVKISARASFCCQPRDCYNQAPRATNDISNSFAAFEADPMEARRQRSRKWTAYGLSLICALSMCCTIYRMNLSQPLYVDVTGEDLLDLKKCPACYGVNKCPAMMAGKIQLNGWSQLTAFQMVNTKNVFFGRYKDKNIVLKKLGSSSDLQKLDETILALANATADETRVRLAIRFLLKAYMRTEFHADQMVGAESGVVKEYLNVTQLKQDLIQRNLAQDRGSNLLTCLSSAAMDFIVDRVYEYNFGQNRLAVLNNVLTVLLINPEPLLLQAFPAAAGWPFPKYRGACGRVVMEERVETSLANFAGANFTRRASLALELLDLARNLTSRNQDFSLYWSDVTENNLAVDSEGRVKIIDAGNIILVDKNLVRKERIGDWDKPWKEESWNSSEGFGYIEEELCTHLTSDHNIHALCHGLLAPDAYSINFPKGLLYDPPSEILQKYPDFTKLLETCKDPAMHDHEMDRFEAAQRIGEILASFKDLSKHQFEYM